MSAVTDEIHKLIAELEAQGHALAERFRTAFAKLHNDETTLQTEVAADVTKVETAAAPVVDEAKTDAGQLASEAVADIKDATEPAPPVAPPAAPAA